MPRSMLLFLVLFFVSLQFTRVSAQTSDLFDKALIHTEGELKLSNNRTYQTSIGSLESNYSIEPGATMKLIDKGLKLLNGILKIPKGDAIELKDGLKIIKRVNKSSEASITVVQDQATGMWLGTDGSLVFANEVNNVQEGHVIRIIDGKEKPIQIGKEYFYNCTVYIKEGKPVKKD